MVVQLTEVVVPVKLSRYLPVRRTSGFPFVKVASLGLGGCGFTGSRAFFSKHQLQIPYQKSNTYPPVVETDA